jgi:hypothetical protein
VVRVMCRVDELHKYTTLGVGGTRNYTSREIQESSAIKECRVDYESVGLLLVHQLFACFNEAACVVSYIYNE